MLVKCCIVILVGGFSSQEEGTGLNVVPAMRVVVCAVLLVSVEE